MVRKLSKGSRITGQDRTDLVQQLVARYERGESIRSIATDIGRSYGFVHGLLAEHVTLRGRGGATRGPRAAARREELLAAAHTKKK